MAQSNFRRQNLSHIQMQACDLIEHVTKFDRGDENFGIAEEFIMAQIQNNSFQDTNENEIRRMIEALQAKQRVHNQEERADRFKYLIETFKKKPMRQEGISDAHMSMVHLLFLLADNPVGPDGYIDENIRGRLSTKIYLTKEQAEEQHKHFVEDQIREIQKELKTDHRSQQSDEMDDNINDEDYSSEDIDDEDEDVQREKQEDQSPAEPNQ